MFVNKKVFASPILNCKVESYSSNAEKILAIIIFYFVKIEKRFNKQLVLFL